MDDAPRNWVGLINTYTRYYGTSAAPGSVALRRYYLDRLAATFADTPPLELTLDDLATWLSNDGWGPSARKSARDTVRGFYRWAVRVDLLVKSPAEYLPAIPQPRGVPKPTPDQVFFDALATEAPRERLMLMLAAFGGLRRGEISRVHTRDLEGDVLRVTGKGGRTRLVPILHRELLTALRALPPGYAFPGAIDGHLSAKWVGDLLSDAMPEGWTAHTLRHRFGTRALRSSGNLRVVQELMGHAKPETTAIYTLVTLDDARAAVAGVA